RAAFPDNQTAPIASIENALGELDRVSRERVPQYLSGLSGHSPLAERLEHTFAAFDATPRPLSSWAAELQLLLERILQHEAEELLGRSEIESAIIEWHQSTETLYSFPGAIELLRYQLRDSHLTPEPGSDSIEILGWLELLGDPADTLYLTDFNQGLLPAAPASDPFLPESLREQLGLPNYRQRLRRDRALLRILFESRPHVQLIAPKYVRSGDALLLSQLAYPADPREQALRVEQFFSPSSRGKASSPRRDVDPNLSASSAESTRAVLGVRPAVDMQCVLPRTLPITCFRRYIECPYRFYLLHVLGLEDINDDVHELGPDVFGTLAHAVLAGFGISEVKDSEHESAIFEWLNAALERRIQQQFGSTLRPSISLQLEMLRSRLRAFAAFQATHRAEGWQILLIEQTVQTSLELPSGRQQLIRGQIDRIDRHRHDGRHLIIDYKTAERAISPQSAYSTREQAWHDPQLALYRFLAERELGIPEAELAYLPLSSESASVSLSKADWDTTICESGVEVAREIAVAVQNREFWPPTELERANDLFGELVGASAVDWKAFEDEERLV
ncbi:MAG: PD-(D/E)XK nuclease family protein, partial [Bdellovibrionales bacterium]|nr:PD-(D/E)XK nuclease family protein [Bdellovibrionales bacterium]